MAIYLGAVLQFVGSVPTCVGLLDVQDICVVVYNAESVRLQLVYAVRGVHVRVCCHCGRHVGDVDWCRECVCKRKRVESCRVRVFFFDIINQKRPQPVAKNVSEKLPLSGIPRDPALNKLNIRVIGLVDFHFKRGEQEKKKRK